jgi:DNA (cytosine-5)-methyltransferase 1
VSGLNALMGEISATDMFCGAGGSSLGAAMAGVRLELGLNHWRLAIDTHQENFPDAGHDCADVSMTDPRRYRRTTVLIAVGA